LQAVFLSLPSRSSAVLQQAKHHSKWCLLNGLVENPISSLAKGDDGSDIGESCIGERYGRGLVGDRGEIVGVDGRRDVGDNDCIL